MLNKATKRKLTQPAIVLLPAPELWTIQDARGVDLIKDLDPDNAHFNTREQAQQELDSIVSDCCGLDLPLKVVAV